MGTMLASFHACGQTWDKFNSGIGIDGQFWNWNCLFKKKELELIFINLELELKFSTKS